MEAAHPRKAGRLNLGLAKEGAGGTGVTLVRRPVTIRLVVGFGNRAMRGPAAVRHVTMMTGLFEAISSVLVFMLVKRVSANREDGKPGGRQEPHGHGGGADAEHAASEEENANRRDPAKDRAAP